MTRLFSHQGLSPYRSMTDTTVFPYREGSEILQTLDDRLRRHAFTATC